MDFFKHRKQIKISEEGGAGEIGTPSLVAKYKNLTPGQSSGAPTRQPARKGDKLNTKDEPAPQGGSKLSEGVAQKGYNVIVSRYTRPGSASNYLVGTYYSKDEANKAKKAKQTKGKDSDVTIDEFNLKSPKMQSGLDKNSPVTAIVSIGDGTKPMGFNEKKVFKNFSDYEKWAKSSASNGMAVLEIRQATPKDPYYHKYVSEEIEISELSKDLLARYKKKAGAHASAMQKAASDVASSSARPQDKTAVINTLMKKGDKRFSGIVKATKKQFAKEAKEMKGEDPCWKGYEMVGTKKKNGKEVPNCVPANEQKHISPSGVETNMSPKDDDYEMNYGKNGTVAKFRKNQGLDIKTGKKKVEEKLDPSMGAGEYVKDFEKSDAPQFKGKTKKERQKMAVAAYLAAKRGD